jgi:pimeloyl-ACP methyl ester carboxylesterase
MILHSKIIGGGPPFIILHGFLGMGDNWKSLGNNFADMGYEVHLVDQRNHGRSFHSDDFSLEDMVDDLVAYCDHFKIKNIILLGHSMGGKVAMLFAVNHPERVKRLIIADISPKKYPLHHGHILSALAKLDSFKIESRGEADRILAETIHEVGIRLFLLKNLFWIDKGELGLRINLPVLTRKNEEVVKSLPEGTYYLGETLFLFGAKSGYFVEGDDLLIKNHFPNSKIVTISNAGHWLHAENPKEFSGYVMNFL